MPDTTPGVSDALDGAGGRDERSVIVTLAPGVSVRRVGVEDVVVTAARGELPLGGLPPGIARAPERLERGSAASDDMTGRNLCIMVARSACPDFVDGLLGLREAPGPA